MESMLNGSILPPLLIQIPIQTRIGLYHALFRRISPDFNLLFSSRRCERSFNLAVARNEACGLRRRHIALPLLGLEEGFSAPAVVEATAAPASSPAAFFLAPSSSFSCASCAAALSSCSTTAVASSCCLISASSLSAIETILFSVLLTTSDISGKFGKSWIVIRSTYLATGVTRIELTLKRAAE